MADIPPFNPASSPVPTGAVPPKKETGKVQPKKETVRINLPPKPTAAPTIKLPTLPPGGPTGAPIPITGSPAFANRPAAAPAAAPKAAAPKAGAAPAAPAAQRSAPAQRSSVPAAVPALKTLDKALIFSAAVASLLAVGGVVWVFITLKSTVESFNS
jgi:hypothetical protein